MINDTYRMLVDLTNRIKYSNDKNALLQPLEENDLYFLINLFCVEDFPEKKTYDIEIILRISNISKILNSLNNSIYLQSFEAKILIPIQKNELIKIICEQFSEPHLCPDMLLLHLSAEPEIGLFEKLFKEPKDINQQIAWQKAQDFYWKAIAKRIDYDLPKSTTTQQRVTHQVRNYLKEYKKSISNLSDANNEITNIIKTSVTIEKFLRVKEWKRVRDSNEQFKNYKFAIKSYCNPAI